MSKTNDMTYTNPFYNAKYQNSKPEYTAEDWIDYQGYQITHSAQSKSKYENVFDIVQDGKLIGQRVTLASCKKHIDTLINSPISG